MAKRRRAVKAKEVKAGRDAAEKEQPRLGFRRESAFRRRLVTALLSLLTVPLLSVSFAPIDYWFLAYVALVPWVLALDAGSSRWWSLLLGWLCGLLFWAANLYWLWWITLLGYGATVFYLSLYWLAAAIVLRQAMRRDWPCWIVLPVVWVALEYLRAYVISGFPWLYLAHSQYARTPLIQISDLTGQYGVSFFVAMVNGALVDVLRSLARRRQPGRGSRGRIISAVAASVLVGGVLLLYGALALRTSRRTTSPGPVIGIVQHAFPISLVGRSATAEKIFGEHLKSSQKLLPTSSGRKCDLVIWPETMLPRGLNPQILQLDPKVLDSTTLRSLAELFLGPGLEAYSDERLQAALKLCIEGGKLADGTELTGLREHAKGLAELSRKLDCPILAGGSTIHRNLDPLDETDQWLTRNSAMWFDRIHLASATYSKCHLVPFSEYVPFKRSWPAFHKLLRRFVPPVMEQLDPGRSSRPFELIRAERRWRLACAICYEGTFARICRRMIVQDGKKRADILVNLSNDGWFVYRWRGGSYQASTEHAQHLVQYCFRSVENRVAIIRAVNTGISASIDSNGRIVAKLGLTLDNYKKYTMIAGTLLLDGARENDEKYQVDHGPQVLVDSRISVYSLTGDFFALLVSVSAILLSCRLAWRWREGKSQMGAMRGKGKK